MLIYLPIVLVSFLVLACLVWLRAARLPPRNGPDDPALRSVCVAVSHDPTFEDICIRICKMSRATMNRLQNFLNDPGVRVVARFPLLGGWAGQPDGESRPRIALPTWPTENLRWAVAVHECFHVARHISGDCDFFKEFEGGFLQRCRLRVVEEFTVWRKSVNVDIFGTVAVTLLTFLPLLATVTGLYIYLHDHVVAFFRDLIG